MKAKTKLTSLWSILLVLVMVAGLLPMGQVAYAEDTTSINEVYLTYDTSKIILNTAYTEGEVDTFIRNNTRSATSGVSVDPGNSGLNYLNGTSIYGIGTGTGQITEGRTYLLCCRLAVKSGYDWADKQSDTTAIKFYLNGTETTPFKTDYNSYWNSYYVYFTLGTPTTGPIVKSVSIDQSDVSVQAGNSYNFTATVSGNVSDKTVTWSVSGANSSDTKISDEGVLSVGSDETAKSVTVTATSNSDSSKSASQPVTITAAPLTIDSVTVSPKMRTLYTGDTCSFKVTVTGTENDKSVTWSVTGQTSASTAITSDGILTVGKDEAPKNITVKAVSNADSTKYGEASITIYQRVFIDNVSLTYDASKVNLNTAYTEGQVDTLIRNNISSATNGVSVDPGNSGLNYLNGTSIYGIGTGTGQITEGRTYLLCYRLEVATYSGYDWADKQSDTTAIKFYLNGTETTPYKIEYISSNSYYVYFTLGTATAAPHTHTFDQETIKDAALKTDADCTHDAVYYKSCSCGTISTDDADTFTDTGSVLGHAWPEEGSWSKDADKHWYECSRCHLKKDEAAHTAGDWIIDTAATATAAGTKHKECTICDYVTETETIPTIVSEYTVTFNANGHGKAPTAQTVKSGTNATKPTNPTEEGWTFCGWYTDADCTNYFDFSTAITEDTTLYAKWRQNETASKYWCGIYSDRSPYGMVNLDKVNLPSTVVGQVFDAGTELTAYAYPDDGYRFKEWQNEAGDVVSTNNPYTFTLNSEICLYAIFESAPASSTEYTVTVTDGKATSSTSAEISKAAEGTTVTLTANAAPTGKEFDKWVVVSGSITLADASNATTIFTMPKGNVEIKATYKDEPGSDIKYGDLSGDGKINLLDLVAMRKYLAKWSITVDTAAADCNADGKINLMDLILLRKYLAKWSVTLGPQK